MLIPHGDVQLPGFWDVSTVMWQHVGNQLATMFGAGVRACRSHYHGFFILSMFILLLLGVIF